MAWVSPIYFPLRGSALSKDLHSVFFAGTRVGPSLLFVSVSLSFPLFQIIVQLGRFIMSLIWHYVFILLSGPRVFLGECAEDFSWHW